MILHYVKRFKVDLNSGSGDEEGPSLTPMMFLCYVIRSKLELKSCSGDHKGPSCTYGESALCKKR